MKEEKTSTQKEKGKNELAHTKKERDEYLAGWQRAKADLINYKKDEKERIEADRLYARAEILYNILPILDNLERAERVIQQGATKDQIVQGFLQIGKQFRELLKSQGIEEIEAEGETFNLEFHEAVSEVKGKEPGKVAEVVEKGYMLGGRVFRPAKVKITK